ncbi:TniQ family protein [Herbaspirillum sp.]|uniref:TniQ family protein n=1 Tax=Herbaspirillum sp. TaxID=1890675 RepID=UPI00257CD781|nr:TniQ family protein [Herbaspirillum sp.]
MKKVIFPYLAPYYPGEICGSWFSRLKLHNTKALWDAVLSSLDINPSSSYRFFDLDRLRPSTLPLLDYFGIHIDEAKNNLSTVPFLNTFGDYRPIDGRNEKIPHYCSQCIADDTDQFGEPYWHSVHQIQNVLVCPIHAIKLESSCPSCGENFGAKTKHLTGPLHKYCQCGADLRLNVRQRIPRTDKFYRLADFSSSALANPKVTWSNSFAISYLLSKVGSARNLHLLLEKTWRSEPKIFLTWKPTLSLKSIRAWDVAAALVALDLNYAEAISDIAQEDFAIRFSKYDSSSEEIRNVEQAKERLQKYMEDNPQKDPSSLKVAYEFIRIHDLDWLRQIPGRKTRRELPSIEADRNSILSYLSRIGRRSISTYAPHVRARIRDHYWLKSHSKERVKKYIATVDFDKRDQAIELAMTELMRRSSKPKRFNNATIARAVGLSEAVVIAAITKNKRLQELRSSCDVAIKTHHINDAIQKVTAANRRISKWTIANELGWATSGASMKLIARVLDEHLSNSPVANNG